MRSARAANLERERRLVAQKLDRERERDIYEIAQHEDPADGDSIGVDGFRWMPSLPWCSSVSVDVANYCLTLKTMDFATNMMVVLTTPLIRSYPGVFKQFVTNK